MVDRKSGGLLGPMGRAFGEGTVAGLTDVQLLERYAVRGDPSAFEALMTRYGPMVLGVCRRRLRDGHAAEDAFQATFLVLVRKAGSIRVGRSIGPWIHGVAWRVAERARSEAARRADREVTGQAAEHVPARLDPESRRRELAEVLDEELIRLPEKYRVPVVLCHLEGLTHEEAAQRLGCPAGTVSIRLMRAHARLRDRLARRGASPMALGLLAAPVVPPGLFEDVLLASIGKGVVPPVAAALTGGVLRAMMRSKIRKAAIGLISMGFVAALATLALAYLPQAHKTPKAVNGKVVDDRGQPIAGAEVWLPTGYKATDPTAHAVTDDGGRFSLPVPEAALKDEMAATRASLWVFARGHSIGTGGTYQVFTGKDTSDVVIRLGPPTDTAFTVIGPDSRPVARARVDPYYVQAPNTAYEFPPKEMLASIGGVTDERGRVRLPSMERKGFGKVAVVTEAFGRQLLRLTDRADEPAERTIRLRATGKIEGQIVASRPELARGVDLYFSTEEELSLGGWVAEGEAHVVTDEQGRFAVPALASGKMNIGEGADHTRPFRLRLPERLMVRPGDSTRVDLPMEPALKVQGVVRSRETKQPLAKATIRVGYGTWQQGDTVTTGPDGKYEAFVVPGNVRLQLIMMPDGYIQLGAPWNEPVAVPEDVESFDLPTIDLVKSGPPIPGKLVDGRDRPLAEVRINAVSGNRRYGFAETDAKGAFTLEGIPPGLEDLNYEAWIDDGASTPAEVVRTAPLVLRARLKAEAIEEAGSKAAISARVVDREGKPVEGAELTLVEAVYGPDGRYSSGFRWNRLGDTDAKGWCRKPFAPVQGTTYHLIVQPGSTALAKGEAIKADGRGPLAFAPIVADRLVEVAGLVEDEKGRPIAGATVRNWGNASPLTSATTGVDGTFRLGGFPHGEVFLFAEAPGYRFRGVLLPSGGGPARIALARSDGPPSRVLQRPKPAIPHDEAAALAMTLILPDMDRIMKGNDQSSQALLLEALTWSDPEAAWEKIRAGDKMWDRAAAKLAVFRAFREQAPDSARAALSLIKTPYYRFSGLQQLIDAMPADQSAEKKTLLNQALAEVRQLDEGSKVGFSTHFARRLADLGELESARAVVDEMLAPAKALDNGIGRPASTQALADVLARVDPKAAEALIPKGGNERARNDMLGSVAEGVAVLDPARAERLLKQFTHDSSEVFAVHTCRRMVAVDLPRARRIAASMKSEALRGYALGLMADALATADPSAANTLLDDSFRAFTDSVLHGQGNLWSGQSASMMAASLLPVVGRIRPDRLDEFAWRAVSLRWQPRKLVDLTMSIPDNSRITSMNQSATLALFLARYDLDLARFLLAPAVDGFLATTDGNEISWLQWRLILMTLAQVDPARAVDVARIAPDVKEAGDRPIREDARLTVAKGLVEDLDVVIADCRMWIIDLEILLREAR